MRKLQKAELVVILKFYRIVRHLTLLLLGNGLSHHKKFNFGWLWMVVPEQKARVTYDNILRLSDDPDVNNVIKFLREREVVHFQRFGEAIQLLREKLDQKNVYYMNPSFDM